MHGDDPRVLILHDNDAWRRCVSTALARRGVACIVADAAQDHRAMSFGQHGAVVVGPVPGRTAETARQAVARMQRCAPRGKVVALVPPRHNHHTRESFRAGAWDCLEEPVDPAELAECVADAMRRHGAHHGRRYAEAGHIPVDPGLPSDQEAFLGALASLRSLCRRNGQPLSIMMVNAVGPGEGPAISPRRLDPRVRTWLAANLKKVCRRSDLIDRYSGDTLIAALPHSRGAEAVELARRLQDTLQNPPLELDGRPCPATASVGIAESTIGFSETGRHLIQRARLALERANREGGGRIVTWGQLVEMEPSSRDMKRSTVERISYWVERVRQQLRSTYVESTRALVAAVEAKDPCTRAHSMTVATYAEAIGKRMGLPAGLIKTLRAAATLHDVGKIGVPDAILTKTGPLTDDEFAVVKRHPETGLEILGHVSFLTDERPLILHHHERYDGTGYPCGLAGDQIPVGARVLAVADALDAMLSRRSYKEAYDVARVRRELAVESGRQFDPAIAAQTLRWLQQAPEELATITPAS
jgi:HD-GYP domain-containing protein (c-di-GMP phosphodiesterase class II)/DNA-binding response OmpR family regulator